MSDEVYEHFQLEDQQVSSKRLLTLWTAGIFIAGEIVGSGVLTLPYAADGLGDIGFLILLICGAVSAYTAALLGESWCIVRDRYPEYRGQVRYPYSAMAEITYGKLGRYVVSFSANFTCFGTSVAFLIMASENISALLMSVQVNISFCSWLLIVGVFIIPFNWLGTPKDFWPIAVWAAVFGGGACITVIVSMLMDIKQLSKVVHSQVTFQSFFAAFGTVVFTFGGHMVFPTLQNDMRDQNLFGKSVIFAYTVAMLMFFPVSATGYFVYGRDAQANILMTITKGPLVTAVLVLITLHLICEIVLLLNPVSQEIEEVVGIPNRFGWKRCVLRTLTMCAVIFGAETIPKFTYILSLIGGSTMAALSFIYPPMIYFQLTRMKGTWDEISVSLHKKVFLYEIMFVGVVAGVASTYSAITNFLSADSFTLPCYVNLATES